MVRSADEILATLDESACLDGIPFMPQMLQHCGKTLRVRKSAHKICDTAFATGARSLSDAVFLDGVNCDGQAFGGCEMQCSIVWKDAWLSRADDTGRSTTSLPNARLTELVWSVVRPASQNPAGGEPIFSCQATKLPAATTLLPWWKMGQYVEDYRTGNVAPGTLSARLLYLLYSKLVASGLGLGFALRGLYDLVQWLRGGDPYPEGIGRLRAGGPTPAVTLGLQVGDLVRVKSLEQILETVDKNLMNRGMGFHPEMAPFCGKTFRVKQRVQKIINEKNGRLVTLKNSCLVLDGVGCHGRFTNPVNCPRAFPPYWREIWLERVEAREARAAAE